MPTHAYLQKVFASLSWRDPGLDLHPARRDNQTVITCTKCGEKNSDDTRFCARCNRKLQSSRRAAPAEDSPVDDPLVSFEHQGMPADAWRDLKRLMEAWGYLLLLAGVAAGCWWYRTWWPLYPTVGLLALLIYFRRV